MNKYLILQSDLYFTWINITNFSEQEVSLIEMGIRACNQVIVESISRYKYPEDKQELLSIIEEQEEYPSERSNYKELQELLEQDE